MNNHELMTKTANAPKTILYRVLGGVLKMTYGKLALVYRLCIPFIFVTPVYADQNTVQLTQQPQADIQVKVTTSMANEQQLQLRYTQPIRLNQILEDSRQNLHRMTKDAAPSPIYWLGASIHLNRIPPGKERVMSQLQALAQHWQGENKNAVFLLIERLQSLTFQQRVFSMVDYDQIRITPSLNPLITENMLLILPPRPKDILVLGAVSSPQQIFWRERTSAREYLTQLSLLDNPENSEVVVIQPDGIVEHHPIAYWNHEHRDIAPGATLYLGFQNLPSGFASLNEDIINLLRHRAL
ncbi:capsule biosynthesis GfcC family protein [Photobacterium sp. MCCC 1A19761]|uniref:capsule biosynthesis GfcC family protein n=1 Tax=Photobacterium sp. MCCC 1A19761 TaxID=3115000 RepID=UPI00307F391B